MKSYIRELCKWNDATLEVIRESPVKRKDIQFKDDSDELKEALKDYGRGGGVDGVYRISKGERTYLILAEDKDRTLTPNQYMGVTWCKRYIDPNFDNVRITDYVDDKAFVSKVLFVSHRSMYTDEAWLYLYAKYIVIETHVEFTPEERFGFNPQKYHAFKSALRYSKLGTLINIFLSDTLFKYTENPNPKLFPKTKDNKIPVLLYSILSHLEYIRDLFGYYDMELYNLPKLLYIVKFKNTKLEDFNYNVNLV